MSITGELVCWTRSVSETLTFTGFKKIFAEIRQRLDLVDSVVLVVGQYLRHCRLDATLRISRNDMPFCGLITLACGGAV